VKALLEDLVGANGLRLNIIRVPIAASDSTWNAEPYSYDPWDTSDPLTNSVEGSADPNLRHFSLAHDETYIIPELQQIKEIVDEWSSTPVHFIATPWSPPGWMKQNNNGMIGGTLQSRYLPVYADYLAAFVKGYADHGLPIYALVPQNEPGQPADYPSMTLPPADEAAFIHQHLAPKLHALDAALAQKHFPPVKIFGYDHNWGGKSGQQADGKSDPSTSYPEQLLTELQRLGGLADLQGVSFHCYGGNDSSYLTTLHRKGPMSGKDIYLTECDRAEYNKDEPAQNGQPARYIGENDSYAEGIQKLIYAMNNWSQSYLAWQLVLHPDGTPDQGHGCMGSDWNCIGTVSITPGEGLAGLTRQWDYAYLGHASKFVDRGAQVVTPKNGSDSKDVDRHGGKFESAAFVNPDGTRVLVGYNSSTTNHARFEIVWQGHALDVNVPPRSAVTYKWTASGAAPVYSNPAPSALNIGFNGGSNAGGSQQFDFDWTFFNTGSVQPAERICHTYVDWELANETGAPNIDGPGGERSAFAAWLRDAGAVDPMTGHVHCDEVLVSFQAHDMKDVKTAKGTTTQPVPGAVCTGAPAHGPPCEAPSDSDYETAVRKFLKIDWATVSNFQGTFAFTPWNEPQNSAPDGNGLGTVIAPEVAARYYLILANLCADQGCKVAAGDFASNGTVWPNDFEYNCIDSDKVNTHSAGGGVWCNTPSSENPGNKLQASYLDRYKNYISVHWNGYANLTGLPRYFAYHGWHDANQFIESSQKGHANQCTTYGDCVARKVLSSMRDSWGGAEIWDTEVGASQGVDISDKLQAETAAFLIRQIALAPQRMTRLYYTRLYNGPPHDGGELVSGAKSKPTVRPALCVLADRLGSYSGATCPLPGHDTVSTPNQVAPESDASVPDTSAPVIDSSAPDTTSAPGPAVLAFQSGAVPGDLWTVAANGVGSDRGTAIAGSPSLATLQGGGSAVAFQETQDGTLYVLSGGTVTATGQQMAPGSNPSIAGQAGGGWAVAFQAFGNSSGLAVVTSTNVASPTLTSIPMIQSPSIASTATGWVVAFEAANDDLQILTQGDAAPVDTGLAMMAPSSPAIVALPTGAYQVAYQTPEGGVAVYGSVPGTSNPNLVPGSSLMSGTNPNITFNGSSGNYWVAYVDNAGKLWVTDSSGAATNPGSVVTTAADASPCIGPAGSSASGTEYQVAFQTTSGTLSTVTAAGVSSLGFPIALGTSPACGR
jgi:glucosylceramidase